VTNTGIVRKRAAVVAVVIVAAAPVVVSSTGEYTAEHSGAEAYQAFSDDAAAATRWDIASRSDPSIGPKGFA
jgi:hypothetical protein